jgi:hypothetical protein
VAGAENVQAVGEGAGAEVGCAGQHEARGFASSVRVDNLHSHHLRHDAISLQEGLERRVIAPGWYAKQGYFSFNFFSRWRLGSR